jgi:hypothetical protein
MLVQDHLIRQDIYELSWRNSLKVIQNNPLAGYLLGMLNACGVPVELVTSTVSLYLCLAQDKGKRKALVRVVMNLLDSIKCWEVVEWLHRVR